MALDTNDALLKFNTSSNRETDKMTGTMVRLVGPLRTNIEITIMLSNWHLGIFAPKGLAIVEPLKVPAVLI